MAAIAPLRVMYVFPSQNASLFRAFLDTLSISFDRNLQLERGPDAPNRFRSLIGACYVALIMLNPVRLSIVSYRVPQFSEFTVSH